MRRPTGSKDGEWSNVHIVDSLTPPPASKYQAVREIGLVINSLASLIKGLRFASNDLLVHSFASSWGLSSGFDY